MNRGISVKYKPLCPLPHPLPALYLKALQNNLLPPGQIYLYSSGKIAPVRAHMFLILRCFSNAKQGAGKWWLIDLMNQDRPFLISTKVGQSAYIQTAEIDLSYFLDVLVRYQRPLLTYLPDGLPYSFLNLHKYPQVLQSRLAWLKKQNASFWQKNTMPKHPKNKTFLHHDGVKFFIEIEGIQFTFESDSKPESSVTFFAKKLSQIQEDLSQSSSSDSLPSYLSSLIPILIGFESSIVFNHFFVRDRLTFLQCFEPFLINHVRTPQTLLASLLYLEQQAKQPENIFWINYFYEFVQTQNYIPENIKERFKGDPSYSYASASASTPVSFSSSMQALDDTAVADLHTKKQPAPIYLRIET